MSEGVKDGVDSHVFDGDSHRPARKPVDDREQVFEPIGRSKRHDVKIQVLEAFFWDLEVANRGRHVLEYFRALAVETLACPS